MGFGGLCIPEREGWEMDLYFKSGIEGTVAVVCRDGLTESLAIVISGLGVDINIY